MKQTQSEAIEHTQNPDDVIFCPTCKGWLNVWEAQHNLTYLGGLADCCQIRLARYERIESAHTAHARGMMEAGDYTSGFRLA